MRNRETESFLSFAESTVKSAGEVLLAYKTKFTVQTTKDLLALDIATTADFAAEKTIVDLIQQSYPDHNILTEETKVEKTDSLYEWIIDPLDGTKEYVRNVPYYYTLLALEHKGELICGAGYQPEIKRLFSGSKATGAKMNGNSIAVSKTFNLDRSFVSIALPVSNFPEELTSRYLNFIGSLTYRAYKLRNTPWDVEALFNVASGVVDAYISPSVTGPKWWDIASGLLMVEAAGGVVTDFYGNKIVNRDISKGILACNNSTISEVLLNLLADTYLR